jgi:chemotaxis protein MotB
VSRGRAQEEDGGDSEYFGAEWVGFDESSNRGGWLVTYADMMTIILTFMILLLSVSTIAETEFDLLVEAMTGRKVGNLHKVKEKVDDVVEKASLGGQVTTSIDEDGLKIQFSNALLFESGESELTDEALEVFEPIADHLVESLEPEYGLTIEGYTDDVPIENGEFSSNWDLSTSRATHVMRRLRTAGIDRRRMSVQGFADTRSATDVDLHDDDVVESLSDEELEEARAKNRRVVIRVNRLDEEVLRDILEDRNGEDPTPRGADESSDSSGAMKAPTKSSSDASDAPDADDNGGGDERGIEILNPNSDDRNPAEERE